MDHKVYIIIPYLLNEIGSLEPRQQLAVENNFVVHTL